MTGHYPNNRLAMLADYNAVEAYILDNWCEAHRLSKLEPGVLPRLLTPGIAAAHILNTFGMVPGRRRLVFLGVEEAETIDLGFWLAELIPYLLGVEREPDKTPQITLVAPTLKPGQTGTVDFRAPGYTYSSEPFQGTVQYFARDSGVLDEIGLAIVFQPGFEEYWQTWLMDAGEAFLSIVEHGAPIVLGGYDKAETELDWGILSAYGFAPTTPQKNPFTALVSIPDAPMANYFCHSFFALTPSADHRLRTPPPADVSALIEAYHQQIEYLVRERLLDRVRSNQGGNH